MNTADRPKDGNVALVEKADWPGPGDEVIFPAVDARYSGTVAEEVVSLAIERTPTAEELKAMFSPSASEVKIAVEKTEKHVSGAKTWPILLTGLVVLVAGISLFLYLRNRPEPAPTPTSSDHSGHTTSTTGETPETAFRISPEKQQLIGVQYGTVEYQTISKFTARGGQGGLR
jgi:hypothetical protein